MSWDKITLFILGLLSVRDLISQNFDIPKDRKWSGLFYNKKEREEIPYCYQLNKINRNKVPIGYKSNLMSKLILVLGNHTKYFEEGVFCDRKKMIKINHLVSTLEASHDTDDLKIMVEAIEKLFFDIAAKINIDFIISLKGGNVILVEKLIQLHNYELIHLTYNRNLFFESFGVSISNENDVKAGNSLRFENIDELLRVAKASKRKLNGIVLDCSFSSGDGIIACVKDFNELINQNDGININSIKHIRTIYSHIDKDISDKLEDCEIEYLFSLNPEIRKLLYKLIHEEENPEIKLSNANLILQKIKDSDLLSGSVTR